MGKILGIDYGKIMTGISITDKNKIFAFGLNVVPTKKLMLYISSIIFNEKIELIVIGLPKKLNNKIEWIIEKHIQKFIRNFYKKYPKILIKRIDERFTSKISFNTIIMLDKRKRKNKKILNKISATIILQSYLKTIENYNF